MTTRSRSYMQQNVGNKSLPAPYNPQKVSDVDMAFPAQVGHLMPHADEIPEEFWNSYGNSWVEMADRWFAEGLAADTVADVKDGIDPATAFRHLHCILGSFEPKHEHKSAAVAFLANEWLHSMTSGGKTYGTPRPDEDEEQ